MRPTTIPSGMQQLISQVEHHFQQRPRIASLFSNCFTNTLYTTIKPEEDGTTFVITGDIPAMWLRDSAAQVRPYLMLADRDAHIADLIEGVVRRQFNYILHDPYANAFNQTPTGDGHQQDSTTMTPLIWERKYEIDSLCYPIQLAYLLWKSTGRTNQFNDVFTQAIREILNVWRVEQHHSEKSTYRFQRSDCPPTDTLSHEGHGHPVHYTGMTWSGFRPSDDACQYGYLIPANMFAVVVLGYVEEIADHILEDSSLAQDAAQLRAEIDHGIMQYGVTEHSVFGPIYAYETDGTGNYNLMDDANIPSLLAAPYLGYCNFDDPLYQNTRRFILSQENPYFYEGAAAKGVGSPHTPERYIWHISLAVQGLTALDDIERIDLLNTFETTDALTGMMHEGFHVDDPTRYTREWFSWANMMFCEFVLSLSGSYVKGSPLANWQQNQ